VTKTQTGAAPIATSAGAVAEVATRERYLSPDEAAEYLNVSVGFIRRMASERRVRHTGWGGSSASTRRTSTRSPRSRSR
jgi:excisionase family DNA binding protein